MQVYLLGSHIKLNDWPLEKQWVLLPWDPQCFPSRILRKQWGRGGTKLTVFHGTSHLVFCYTSQLQTRKNLQRNSLLYSDWLINLLRFQRAWSDHVQVESSCCCFPRELVSFVRARELVGFDPRHVTCFPPIGKRIWAYLRYIKDHYLRKPFNACHACQSLLEVCTLELQKWSREARKLEWRVCETFEIVRFNHYREGTV